MEKQTAPDSFAQAFADEVYAEMSRQRLTNNDLAEAMGVTPHTAGTRINRRVPFNAIEMSLVAMWLRIELEELVRRARAAVENKEAAAA